MTGSKNQFLSLEDLKGSNVSFRNGKKGEIIGVGKVGKTDLSHLLFTHPKVYKGVFPI